MNKDRIKFIIWIVSFIFIIGNFIFGIFVTGHPEASTVGIMFLWIVVVWRVILGTKLSPPKSWEELHNKGVKAYFVGKTKRAEKQY